MGNCQAVEMAAAVVEYPGGKVARVVEVEGMAVPAQHLMSLFPGHFVALQLPPAPAPAFQLLAADAPLRLGHRYRLLSFEEVLTYFSKGACGGPRSANTARPDVRIADKRLINLSSGKDAQARML